MTDMEYTLCCIKRESDRLQRILREPEPGLASWYLMLGDCMKRLHDLKVTQEYPERLRTANFTEVYGRRL
jgi:hypothetical protein